MSTRPLPGAKLKPRTPVNGSTLLSGCSAATSSPSAWAKAKRTDHAARALCRLPRASAAEISAPSDPNVVAIHGLEREQPVRRIDAQ